MNQDRIQYLLTGYMAGALEEEEQEELREAVLSGDADLVKTDLQKLIEEYASRAEPVSPEEISKSLQLVLSVDRQAQAPVVAMQHRNTRWLHRWGWAAAVILLLAGISIYRLTMNSKHPQSETHMANTKDIAPGKDGALLTLANGTQVLLDTIQNAVVALQGGVTAKVVDGRLTYEGAGQEIVYNTMSTPKGRQFQLTLPDGTKVWLNAASSIRYPTVFAGAERHVMVTGEAYFEVAKDNRKPFRVGVGNRMEVDVLGTHFNINAYEDEAGIRTTLLEGAVRVKAAGEISTLKPGQQAQIDQGITVSSQVDLEKVMAWKNGLFNFEDASLQEIMRQLERWYDIEVVFRGPAPAVKLTGEISRGLTLNGLLTGMKNMGVQFTLEGRTLIVSAPESI